MKNVTSKLINKNTAIDELEVFLGTQGDSKWIDPYKVEFYGSGIIVEYSKKHKLKSIFAPDHYDENNINKLANEIANALAHSEHEVAQRYLHSYSRVKSYYKHKCDFQILPVPSDAPQPDFEYAHHPFLLEYSYPSSPNPYVKQHRAQKRFSELSLFLNAVLYYIHLPKNSGEHEWVISGSPNWGSHYMQTGYRGGKQHLPKDSDGFSCVANLKKTDSKPTDTYYSQIGVEAGTPFQVPENFVSSIEAFDQIDEESKATFCRASYWKHVSNQVYSISKSSSFASLVSAIEVFLTKDKELCSKCNRSISKDCCKICHQPFAGPTKKFQDFIEEFAKEVPRKDLKKIYNTRSQLSHGSKLLPGDLAEIGFRQHPSQNHAWNENFLLNQIVQIVLVNWLHRTAKKTSLFQPHQF